MHPYLPQSSDPQVQTIVEGLIERQSRFLALSPYASAFSANRSYAQATEGESRSLGRNLYVVQHNFESDSIGCHIWLSYEWWRASGRSHCFTADWLRVVEMLLHLMTVEQHHEQVSPYRYPELPRSGLGAPVRYTGMVWSGSRPSDSQQRYGYLVPANMLLVVALSQLQEIATTVYRDARVAEWAHRLAQDIDYGIHAHGVVESSASSRHNKGPPVYAYEVDGLGHMLTMDDANAPNLLSLPYFHYRSAHDPEGTLLTATRHFVLSRFNRWFFRGSVAEGLGSDHTGYGRVWPLSIAMQGLTSTGQMRTFVLAL